MSDERFFLYDFYLLRAPVFSIDELQELNGILDKIVQDETDTASWDQLRERFSHPWFLEAVYFASKDLYAALQEWLRQPDYNYTQSGKLLKGLHRYYSRMCTRGTPFGLFAGCACGSVSTQPTQINFASEKIRRHVRFDMAYITALTRLIERDPAVQQQTRFFVNNTLYRTGNRYVYLENTMKNGRSSYIMSALSVSPYIEKALKRAADGATIQELEDCILNESVKKEAVQQFIRGMIGMQVLISELQPAVTGDDFVQPLLNRTTGIPHLSVVHDLLRNAQQLLHTGIPDLDAYTKIEKTAGALLTDKKIEIIQEDAYFNMNSNNISRHVVEDIAKTSEKLWDIVPVYVSPELKEFAQRFHARYEEQEIPLVKALDPDIGIGYGLAVSGVAENMPLIDTLAIAPPPEDNRVFRGAYEQLLFEKLKLFLEQHTPVIVLTEEDVDQLIAVNNNSHTPVQNHSAYIFGSILSPSQPALDQGDYKFLALQLHAYAAGRMLGRFAQGEPALQEKLRACAADEDQANPGVILAEVVYMPEGRGANVVLRPRFRDFEIPYLCNTAAAKEQTININDLMVSVRNRRVVLRSRTFNREIVPQVSNAFNARKGQPMYRFLTDLRSQYVKPPFKWEWTEFYNEPYLPRIEYRNFILQRARWQLKQESGESLSTPALTDAYFHKVRALYHIPRYVVLTQNSDNELFIDLDSAICRQHIVRQLKNSAVILLEFLHTSDQCFIRDQHGGYNNQVVIPLGTRLPFFADTVAQPAVRETDPVRHFPPGSDWLYVKIYAGNKTLDTLLVSIIRPFADKALQDNAISKWFFIRYNDPEGHLRIRFHAAGNRQAWLELLPALNNAIAPLIQDNRVAKMTADTYIREIERYGADTITESETLFFADSVAVSSFLDMIEGDEGEQLRWQLALYSVDRLLQDFSCSLAEKKDIINATREAFTQEFSNHDKRNASRLERSLNDKYRKHYPQIKEVLSDALPEEMADMYDCFRQRSNTITAIANAIKEQLAAAGNPQAALKKLLISYIHMNMNRLFLARQRAHELVIYHYLNKYYQSLIAREKQTSATSMKINIS
ncbi:lantibiotic dehydratase [Chitinophaga solisilvae]|uniref:lantibiotic dehydratase n=1 Tax=Chitinophaga solisilvae TaxID=1233460 RepID=UPI00136DC5EF|nr:lantibiotic dehydratase [Chitinophaga solisilvae]